MLGAGRVDVNEQSSLSYGSKLLVKAGQFVGDVVSVVTGAAEIVVAGSGEVASFGVASPVAIPVGIHGSTVIGMGVTNLIKGATNPVKKDESTSSSGNNNTTPSNKPKSSGQTASGHPTDQHGNKLGPSGKPQVNTVKHPSQKKAKDAARNEGKGAPVKHTNPQKGGDHYHPTDKKGNKRPNSTHHEY
jgi:hypothetical protein